jgi:hypothetical protein
MEKFRDADAGHQRTKAISQSIRLRRLVGAHGRDRQLAVFQRHALKLAAREAVGQALQPPVQALRSRCQPLVGCGGQAEFRGDGERLFERQQITVEPPIAAGALDPHVTRSQLVAQVCEQRRVVQPAVNLAVGADD